MIMNQKQNLFLAHHAMQGQRAAVWESMKYKAPVPARVGQESNRQSKKRNLVGSVLAGTHPEILRKLAP